MTLGMMTRRKPQHAAGAFVRLRPSGGWGGATGGPRIGSTEQLAKRFDPAVARQPPPLTTGSSGLQHFHRLASPATFSPTECLMTPVSYSPRAVLRACDVRTRPRSPFTMPPGRAVVLFRRPVPQHGTVDFRRNSPWPQRGWAWGNAPGPTTGRSPIADSRLADRTFCRLANTISFAESVHGVHHPPDERLVSCW